MNARDKLIEYVAIETLTINDSICNFAWNGEIVSIFFNPDNSTFHIMVGHSQIKNKYLENFINGYHQQLQERIELVTEDSESWD